MSRFILLSALLGASIIMFGGLESGSQGQIQECRDWGTTKCWTPYEAVYCHVPKTPTLCFIYVKPKFFNKEGMSNLARHFSKWSPGIRPETRKEIYFHLYDDRNLLENFIRSKHEPVGTYRRGFYARAYGRERLIYKNKDGKDEVIIIK